MKRCFYCDRRMAAPASLLPNSRTRDHLVPRRFRVPDRGRFTVDACLQCNQEKGDLTLGEFRTVRGVDEFPGERRHPGLVAKARRIVEFAGFERFGLLKGDVG